MNFIIKISRFAALVFISIFIGVNCHAQSFLTNGLVAYYPFDGDANDASGQGNNGTVSGTTLATGRFNNPNAAYYFNGTNSAVYLPSAAFNNFAQGTIATWLELDSNIRESIFAKQRDGINSYGIFTVGYYPDGGGGPTSGQPGQLYFHAFNGANLASSSTLLTVGIWHHVAVTFSSTNCNLYIDGILSGSFSGSYSIPEDTSTVTSIGFWGGAPSIGMVGKIDDFRIYNRALSSNEVAQLYSGNLSITIQPQNTIALLGSPASLAVTATGSAPLSYQWLLYGTNISGATNATLAFTNVQLTNSGVYSVVVTSGFEFTNSANAVL